MRCSTSRILKSSKWDHHRTLVSTCGKPLQWLPDCKSVDLKRIANAIGTNASGTKAVLFSNIQHDLQRDRFALSPEPKGNRSLGEGHSIVSIDMGIRNLALCRLALPSEFNHTTVPVIHDWARITVSKWPGAKDAVDDAALSSGKESFDPATYAQYAYSLVAKLLSRLHPTQILIERQRFRSLGGAAVQEWTLRVNMFEAMLYAVLRTLSERGIWYGAVHPISPAKVSPFWLGEAEPGSKKQPRNSSTRTKAAKVELVAKWLQEQGHFDLEGQAAELGQAYLKKREGAKKVVVQQDQLLGQDPLLHSPNIEVGKLDDLADCLLQGMAWIRWENNRRAILADGVRALRNL